MGQDRARVDRFLPLKPFVLDVLLELADGKRHGWSLDDISLFELADCQRSKGPGRYRSRYRHECSRGEIFVSFSKHDVQFLSVGNIGQCRSAGLAVKNGGRVLDLRRG